MKYIDADKLIKSVNNYQEGAKAALNPIDGDADYYQGKIDACKDIQEFITSRQQEIWKPSNEQISAVESAYSALKSHDTWGEDEHLPVLMSVINDLKKLF